MKNNSKLWSQNCFNLGITDWLVLYQSNWKNICCFDQLCKKFQKCFKRSRFLVRCICSLHLLLLSHVHRRAFSGWKDQLKDFSPKTNRTFINIFPTYLLTPTRIGELVLQQYLNYLMCTFFFTKLIINVDKDNLPFPDGSFVLRHQTEEEFFGVSENPWRWLLHHFLVVKKKESDSCWQLVENRFWQLRSVVVALGTSWLDDQLTCLKKIDFGGSDQWWLLRDQLTL